MDASAKVALVTGAAGDIGFAIATRFARAGMTVVLCDRLAEELRQRVAESDVRDRFEPHGVDLTDSAAVNNFAATALSLHRRFDILVNNAAKQHDGDVRSTSEADFDESYAINLRAPYLLSRALSPAMCDARSGSIVNISSVHGLAAGPGRFAYATMKSGLFGLTRSMAVDLGRFNVRVNAVVPTAIRTSGLLKAWSAERSNNEEGLGRLYDWASGIHPMGRIGEADDVAEVVEFLATAKFVSGEVVRVDGAFLAALKLLPSAVPDSTVSG